MALQCWDCDVLDKNVNKECLHKAPEKNLTIPGPIGYKRKTCEGQSPACIKMHIGKSLTPDFFKRLKNIYTFQLLK